MSTSIDDLVTPLTADQAFDTLMAELKLLGFNTDAWRKGGGVRSILRIIAVAYSVLTILIASIAKAGFLETAEGGWLTLLAKYVYGVERPEATFATGLLTLTNAGGGVFTYGPDEVTVTNPSTGKGYKNTVGFTLNAGATLDVSFRAVEAGAASSAPAGTITKLETVMLKVTVSNAAAFIGSDAMLDADLRQLCLDKLATLSPNGPRGAYRYAATVATRPDGSVVDINRVWVSPSSSTGVVTVYVASPSGVPLPDDVTYVGDSIEAIARPDTVTVDLHAVTAVPFSRSVTIWARATPGLGAADVQNLAATALLAINRDYDIGGLAKPPATQGFLYADYVAGVIQGSHPSIFDVDLSGGDMALNAGEVATVALTYDVRIVGVS